MRPEDIRTLTDARLADSLRSLATNPRAFKPDVRNFLLREAAHRIMTNSPHCPKCGEDGDGPHDCISFVPGTGQ